jgi:hypothetical protein
MADNKLYSLLAVLHEVNRRELKNKLTLFSEDLHYYVTVASSIVGAENAKRISETPAGVTENSEEFVSKLLEITNIDDNDLFREVLGTYLLETLKDELKFSCLNCISFERCLDISNLSVGELFLRRVHGEETHELREEISREVEKALRHAPYVASNEAHRLCKDFMHQYNVTNIAEIFGRYTDIAMELQKQYGLDYKKFLQAIVSVNMEFFEKCNERAVPQ